MTGAVYGVDVTAYSDEALLNLYYAERQHPAASRKSTDLWEEIKAEVARLGLVIRLIIVERNHW